jgi:hypothetical protein
MTVAGVVEFREVWRVRLEMHADGTQGIPGSRVDITREYDVIADSFGAAIACAIAFYNRIPGRERMTPENITAAAKTTYDVPILVPTTVAALNYPDVEVTAEITEPHGEFDFDNPFGSMHDAPRESDVTKWPSAPGPESESIPVVHDPPMVALNSSRLNRHDRMRHAPKDGAAESMNK